MQRSQGRKWPTAHYRPALPECSEFHFLSDSLIRLKARLCYPLEGVLGVDSLPDQLVLLGELLGLLDHAFNVFLGQSSLVVGDGNLLGLASTLVLCTDLQDTVGVNFKGDLNLRNSSGCRGDSRKLKLSKQVIVLGHGPFSLINLDEHGRLIVLVGAEHLALLGGNYGVPGNELGHHTSNGLNTQGQGSDVQQQQVAATLSGKDPRLHGSSVRHSLVWVDTSVGLLPVKELLDQGLDLGNTSGTSDKDDLIHILHQSLNLHLDLRSGRKGSLRFLDFPSQFLESPLVGFHVLSCLGLDDLNEVVHDSLVEILTTQVGITTGSHDLKNTVIYGQQRNIKSTASQVIHQNALLGLLVKSEGYCGCRGLVNYTNYIQPGYGTCILRGLTLGIVEVCRDRDYCVLHLLSKVSLRDFLHLNQNHCGNLFRSQLFLLALNGNLDVGLAILINNLVRQQGLVLLDRVVLETTPNKPLDVKQSLNRVNSGLILGRLSN
ncbi:NAD-specific glutamate dehydrogenase [Cryptosporidium felis]|nr:NAD-specific glutamate dehydrogenase [Cryptosporidium felis]